MLETYVNDRFGLRQQLVDINSLARYRLCLSSTKEAVIGKDGWLFYTADKLMDQHTGVDIFTPAELEFWVRQIEADRDWLAKRGIAFYLMIAPDKNTIYPEKLPDYPRGAVTRIDQLAARLRIRTSNSSIRARSCSESKPQAKWFIRQATPIGPSAAVRCLPDADGSRGEALSCRRALDPG